MSLYRIDLEPIGPFFFATEEQAELGNRQNYYRRSTLFPQQTTLLGMLRHQLLLEAGLIPLHTDNHKAKAEVLIGPGSFTIADDKSNFGKVTSISPVALSTREDPASFYLLRPREWCTKDDTIYPVHLSVGTGVKISNPLQNTDSEGYRLQDESGAYLAKHGWVEYLVGHDADLNATGKKIQLHEIVTSPEMTGIQKVFSGGTDENAYYKYAYTQLSDFRKGLIGKDPKAAREYYSYSIKSGWRFTFFVEGDLPFQQGDDHQRIIVMGKEQSLFQCSISIAANNPFQSFHASGIQPAHGLHKVVLVSDAWIPDESAFYKTVLFANTSTRRFRFLVTTVRGTLDYYTRPNKSSPVNLLQRGSVLYTEDVAALADKMTHPAFEQIGYNHFIYSSEKFYSS